MGLHEQRAVGLRGDPGLLGALGGAIKGFVTGGPLGALTGAATGWKGTQPVSRSTGPPPQLPAPGYSGIPRPGGGFVPLVKIPGVKGALERALPGGATGYAAPTQMPGAPPPQGYHWNRSGYWTSQGYVAKGTKLVKNRKRNISNGPANMRALRRIVAWDKADRKRRTTLKRIAR